jgi:hypothetical protein
VSTPRRSIPRLDNFDKDDKLDLSKRCTLRIGRIPQGKASNLAALQLVREKKEQLLTWRRLCQFPGAHVIFYRSDISNSGILEGQPQLPGRGREEGLHHTLGRDVQELSLGKIEEQLGAEIRILRIAGSESDVEILGEKLCAGATDELDWLREHDHHGGGVAIKEPVERERRRGVREIVSGGDRVEPCRDVSEESLFREDWITENTSIPERRNGVSIGITHKARSPREVAHTGRDPDSVPFHLIDRGAIDLKSEQGALRFG